MLRSLALHLLLAAVSLAGNFEHANEHKQNFEVVCTPHNCEEWVDTMIRIQIHETITKIAGREFNRPVQRPRGQNKEDRRQLRTGVFLRELVVDCSAPCGCYEHLACRLTASWMCVDACGSASCACERRLEEDESRLLHRFGETVDAAGVGKDECASWNQGNLTMSEMDSILSCAATKSIKEEMAKKFEEKNSCLGDIDQFQAMVTVLGF